jgi:signal peptidase I
MPASSTKEKKVLPKIDKPKSGKPLPKEGLTSEKLKSGFKEWFGALRFAAIAALTINIFIFQNYNVPTGSMERTILPGDFLVVSKFIYGAKLPFVNVRLPGFRWVKPGDIVVFIQPVTDENYVKRCVAVAGQTLEVRARILYIDSVAVPLSENGQFISPMRAPKEPEENQIFPEDAAFNKDFYGPIRIPKKGDVIKISPETYHLYKALLGYEGHKIRQSVNGILIDDVLTTSYTVEQNYYFMMGDNRDNSLDSRFWGFVPETNIVGTPLFVYWSWDSSLSIFNIFGKLASVRWSRLGSTLD